MWIQYKATLNGKDLTTDSWDTVHEALQEGMKGLDSVFNFYLRSMARSVVPAKTLNKVIVEVFETSGQNLLTAIQGGTPSDKAYELIDQIVAKALAIYIWDKFKGDANEVVVTHMENRLVVQKICVPVSLAELTDDQKKYLENGLQDLIEEILPVSCPRVSLVELEEGHVFSVALD